MTSTFCHTQNDDAAICLVAGAGIEPASENTGFADWQRCLSGVSKAGSYAELVEQLAPALTATAARFVVLCHCNQHADASNTIRALSSRDTTTIRAAEDVILRAAQLVNDGGQFEVWDGPVDDVGRLVTFAVPDQAGLRLVASFDHTATISQETLLRLQTVVLHIAAWYSRAGEIALKRLAALTELLSRLNLARTLPEACGLLVNELQDYLGCQQVVVGLCKEGSTRCRVGAISGVDAFHPHSNQVRTAQAALQEAIARGHIAVWPSQDDNSRFGLKAHEQFASSIAAEAVVGGTLRDDRANVRGAWLVAGSASIVSRDDVLALLRAAESPVASALGLLAQAQPDWIRRLQAWFTCLIRRRRGQTILAALAVAVGLLFLPVPHRVKCDCRLEPVTRRYVAAPFDGLLMRTFVEPGDLVTQGQLLARIDGREVHWELAGVQAELHRASKQRAGHVASHDAGAAEIARHEVDRLQSREQLLKARNQDLDIRSPVEGMLVSGDLKDAEGMPLQIGEVLFEVAPLDAMIVELSIPEDDITYVRDGMPVHITFDAFPFLPYDNQVERIHPRAELRDEQNIFVGEVRLDNSRQTLHPGMRGHARIQVGRAALGWILFRRPLAAAFEWLGW